MTPDVKAAINKAAPIFLKNKFVFILLKKHRRCHGKRLETEKFLLQKGRAHWHNATPFQFAMQKLPRAFYDRDTRLVARELLGKYLVHVSAGVERIGRIVETEAYLGPHDLAAHSSKGLTARTRVMFGPPGHAYVYLIYGMYFCMNVVTQPEGIASAVLLRAVEPVKNVDGRTQGPGLLCRALHIDKAQNGRDLTSEDFYIADTGSHKKPGIVKRPRIGVDYAGHWARRLLRFYVKGSDYVSKP